MKTGLGIALLFFSALAGSAELAICAGTRENGCSNQSYYAADGSRSELAIFEASPPGTDCRQIHLPLAARDVLSLLPVDTRQVQRSDKALVLQGSTGAGRFIVSEVISAEESDASSLLPLQEDSLPHLIWHIFGSEGRARIDTSHRLLCQPGKAVAGAILLSERTWPANLPLQLKLSAKGAGRFAVALSDAERIKTEAPLMLGAIDLTAAEQEVSLPVPYNTDGWSALTLACPDTEAWLELSAVEVQPQPTQRVTHRAAWVWSPDIWLDRPESIWALQTRYRLDAVFITIPLAAGKVLDPEALAAFISAASERKLGIWAVSGDPHDVLAAQRPALIERLAAYAGYNRTAAGPARLAGLQLDIEPYLLHGYALNPELWRQHYLDTVLAARSALDSSLPLDLVMPVWWGSHPQWGRPLLDALAMPGISLTVMDYRTDRRRLLNDVIPFLESGSRNHYPVRIALEAGPLADEEQRHFRAVPDDGELWLLQLGEQQVLILLSSAARGLPGRAYRYTHTTPVSAAAYTFAGNPQRLDDMTQMLVPLWAAWPEFDGVAIHGIDGAL